jgi:hypothetical protein
MLAAALAIMGSMACSSRREPTRARGSSAASPSRIVLGDAPRERCSSAATPVTLHAEGAKLSDLLQLMSSFAQIPITMEGRDASTIIVDASISDVPWDCLLTETAQDLSMVVANEGSRIVLRPK